MMILQIDIKVFYIQIYRTIRGLFETKNIIILLIIMNSNNYK
ncbi:hypothetical protein pb186bvf_011738 [Paramecium bursaria]